MLGMVLAYSFYFAGPPQRAYGTVEQGDDSIATLENRVADLERKLAALQKELQGIRDVLQALAKSRLVALTPEAAVRSYETKPQEPITVEFGVESAGWPDAPIPIEEDPLPPIMADWDGRLANGGKFTLILTAKAIRGLENMGVELPPTEPPGLFDLGRLSTLCKYLRGKGVRVRGLVRASRPGEAHTDYYITVDDARNFRVNESGRLGDSGTAE
jgi:hypothetical protein